MNTSLRVLRVRELVETRNRRVVMSEDIRRFVPVWEDRRMVHLSVHGVRIQCEAFRTARGLVTVIDRKQPYDAENLLRFAFSAAGVPLPEFVLGENVETAPAL